MSHYFFFSSKQMCRSVVWTLTHLSIHCVCHIHAHAHTLLVKKKLNNENVLIRKEFQTYTHRETALQILLKWKNSSTFIVYSYHVVSRCFSQIQLKVFSHYFADFSANDLIWPLHAQDTVVKWCRWNKPLLNYIVPTHVSRN